MRSDCGGWPRDDSIRRILSARGRDPLHYRWRCQVRGFVPGRSARCSHRPVWYALRVSHRRGAAGLAKSALRRIVPIAEFGMRGEFRCHREKARAALFREESRPPAPGPTRDRHRAAFAGRLKDPFPDGASSAFCQSAAVNGANTHIRSATCRCTAREHADSVPQRTDCACRRTCSLE